MKRDLKKILIINTFGIGDVLFSTPMIRMLKEHIPQASIDCMCNKRGQFILQNNTNVGHIIIFEKDDFRSAFEKSKIFFVKMLIDFIGKIRQGKYDLAIDLSLGYQMSLLLMLLGIKKRVGFNFRKRGRFLTDKLNIEGFNDKHAIEYYLDLLKLIGVKTDGRRDLELGLSKGAEEWADVFLTKNGLVGKRLVGMAPGGGKSWGDKANYRRWDPVNFSYVAHELARMEKDLFFLIFGSDEEKSLCCAINKSLNGRVIDLCGKLTLPQSISLIKRCDVVLCNDGGILHIAVSQGTKTVSIFGPVDDNVYGPYPPSENNRVVLANRVNCRPCYRSFRHKDCRTHICLKEIDKDKVLEAVRTSLALDSTGHPVPDNAL